MAQMQNAQSVALQLEKVRDKLPLLYERDDILLTMIQQRGDVERPPADHDDDDYANADTIERDRYDHVYLRRESQLSCHVS